MGCSCRMFREEPLGAPASLQNGAPVTYPFVSPTPEGSRDPALGAPTSHARPGSSFWRMTRGFASLPLTERAPAFAGQGSLWLLSVASLFGGRFTPRRRQLAEVTRNKQRGSRAGGPALPSRGSLLEPVAVLGGTITRIGALKFIVGNYGVRL